MTALSGLYYIWRGLLWGVLGFLFGAGLGALIRLVGNMGDIWEMEPLVAIGYVFGLVGWLLGVGMWEVWVREWFGRPSLWYEWHHGRVRGGTGWRRYFRFWTDHKVIGVQYLVTFVVVLLLAGIAAMLMRVALLTPEPDFLGLNWFNATMSWHGIAMVAVAVAAIIGGFANFFIPLMIGAEDMALPRVNALSYWIIPPVVVLLLLAPLMGGWDTGWTSYPPLSTITPLKGQLLFNLAFLTFGFSSILSGFNFAATILTLRAPGMTLGRLPIFIWASLVAVLLAAFFTQWVGFSMFTVIFDRVLGTSFYKPEFGGDPLLYTHLFWFYSHPAVYIMIVPAFGVVLEVLPHFARKPLFAYRWVVGALMAIGALSGVVWFHHQFTIGQNFLEIPFMTTTELISIPTGFVFLGGLGTIFMARMWLTTPMLFALGFLFNFLIGGLTGIYLADVATDLQLHDTYFVVAHFHYTMMGGFLTAFLAGTYFWFPKITGRMYNERLGKVHFIWYMLAYNLTYLPMFWAGMEGMNRRIAAYTPELAGLNIFISVAAFFLGASFLLWLYNMVSSWVRGPRAPANPWGARTLEWQTSSPPPPENFPVTPHVTGGPYDYVPGAPAHAVVPVAGGEEGRER